MRKTPFLTAAALLALWAGAGLAAAPLAGPAGFIRVPYATWSNEEPVYQLYPGDEVDFTVLSNPELNKTLTVRPDGRITLPIIGDIMAAGRTVSDVRAAAEQGYRTQLRSPHVEMAVKPQPIMVFVGGEVGLPAAYPLVGDGDAMQAIIQAGGFKTLGDLSRVQIIRRLAGGAHAMTEVNLSQALRHGEQPDLAPLARGDIVFVPRTGIANIDLAVSQFVAAIPVQLNYSFNPNTTTRLKAQP